MNDQKEMMPEKGGRVTLYNRDGGQKNSIGISFVQTSSPGSAGFPKPQPSRARRDCFATPSQGVATSYFLGHALSLDSYLPPLPLPAESPSPDPKQGVKVETSISIQASACSFSTQQSDSRCAPKPPGPASPVRKRKPAVFDPLNASGGLHGADSNVTVAIRVRPPILDGERLQGKMCLGIDPVNGKLLVMSGKEKRRFNFNRVYPPGTSQEEVFVGSVEGLVDDFLEGYNATVMAYGQTGSGKTYLVGSTGTGAEEGMFARVARRVFESIVLPMKGPATVLEVACQALQVYNDDMEDLLGHLSARNGPPLALREQGNGEIEVLGATQQVVSSFDALMQVFERASAARTVRATAANETSSRSHAIFTLVLRRWAPVGPGGRRQLRCASKFHLVDLAGSERSKKSKATGASFKELVGINQGLLALGGVINALGQPGVRPTHVPYRQSKLTRLLQDSLGGNSKACMIACIHADASSVNETLNTLQYASRARNIRNRPVIIHHVPPPENTHALRERLLGILASAVAPPLSPGGSSTALAISPRAGYSPGPTSPGVPEWAFEAIPGETASPRWSCPPLAAALLMQLGPQGIWQLLVHVAASHQKTLVDEADQDLLGRPQVVLRESSSSSSGDSEGSLRNPEPRPADGGSTQLLRFLAESLHTMTMAHPLITQARPLQHAWSPSRRSKPEPASPPRPFGSPMQPPPVSPPVGTAGAAHGSQPVPGRSRSPTRLSRVPPLRLPTSVSPPPASRAFHGNGFGDASPGVDVAVVAVPGAIHREGFPGALGGDGARHMEGFAGTPAAGGGLRSLGFASGRPATLAVSRSLDSGLGSSLRNSRIDSAAVTTSADDAATPRSAVLWLETLARESFPSGRAKGSGPGVGSGYGSGGKVGGSVERGGGPGRGIPAYHSGVVPRPRFGGAGLGGSPATGSADATHTAGDKDGHPRWGTESVASIPSWPEDIDTPRRDPTPAAHLRQERSGSSAASAAAGGGRQPSPTRAPPTASGNPPPPSPAPSTKGDSKGSKGSSIEGGSDGHSGTARDTARGAAAPLDSTSSGGTPYGNDIFYPARGSSFSASEGGSGEMNSQGMNSRGLKSGGISSGMSSVLDLDAVLDARRRPRPPASDVPSTASGHVLEVPSLQMAGRWRISGLSPSTSFDSRNRLGSNDSFDDIAAGISRSYGSRPQIEDVVDGSEEEPPLSARLKTAFSRTLRVLFCFPADDSQPC